MRILALDDDNYGVEYFNESEVCFDAYAMVQYLAKKHNSNYEVRCVSLLNHIEEDDTEAKQAFNIVRICNGPYEEYLNAFNYLWEKVSQNDWWKGIKWKNIT